MTNASCFARHRVPLPASHSPLLASRCRPPSARSTRPDPQTVRRSTRNVVPTCSHGTNYRSRSISWVFALSKMSQSGARASETAGVLQELGFTNVKVYDSSWLGYGNTLDAPANNVTFFNVGLLNTRLSTLQAARAAEPTRKRTR